MNDLNWKFGLQVLVHLLINSDKDMNLLLIAGDVDVDRDGARDVTRDESENMVVDENMSQDRNDSQVVSSCVIMNFNHALTKTHTHSRTCFE